MWHDCLTFVPPQALQSLRFTFVDSAEESESKLNLVLGQLHECKVDSMSDQPGRETGLGSSGSGCNSPLRLQCWCGRSNLQIIGCS